jgi:hypothetical protein
MTVNPPDAQRFVLKTEKLSRRDSAGMPTALNRLSKHLASDEADQADIKRSFRPSEMENKLEPSR